MSKKNPTKNPFAQFEAPPPIRTVFARLRQIWMQQAEEAGEKRTYQLLASRLQVRGQSVTQWATGSDGRTPPWWVICKLLDLTDYRLIVGPDEWRLVQRQDIVVKMISPEKPASARASKAQAG